MMFGLSPRAFHLTNLVLHSLVTVLLYDTAVTRHLLSPTFSLAAAALFAVHPVHSEAVSTNINLNQLLLHLWQGLTQGPERVRGGSIHKN